MLLRVCVSLLLSMLMVSASYSSIAEMDVKCVAGFRLVMIQNNCAFPITVHLSGTKGDNTTSWHNNATTPLLLKAGRPLTTKRSLGFLSYWITGDQNTQYYVVTVYNTSKNFVANMIVKSKLICSVQYGTMTQRTIIKQHSKHVTPKIIHTNKEHYTLAISACNSRSR